MFMMVIMVQYDAFDDGKFHYRGHGDDGYGDVMVMAAVIS